MEQFNWLIQKSPKKLQGQQQQKQHFKHTT